MFQSLAIHHDRQQLSQVLRLFYLTNNVQLLMRAFEKLERIFFEKP